MTGGTGNGPEDFDLLAQFNEGSEEAFTRIVEKHSGRLVNFLFRYTRDRAAAEDLAQEAFLRLYKAAPDLRPGAKLSTLLFKIAYNLAVDLGRRAGVRARRTPTASLEAAPDPADPAGDPARGYETGLRATALEKALNLLPVNQRLAMVLKVHEDRSYAEIAEILGVTVPSVESLLFRARQALAQTLK